MASTQQSANLARLGGRFVHGGGNGRRLDFPYQWEWSKPDRRRGKFVTGWTNEGYEVVPVEVWQWDDAAGDLVTSTLPDGQHAPVLDIDLPVRLSDGIEGRPTVLHTSATPWVAARVAERLHALGLIDAEQRRHYQALASGLRRFSGDPIPVTFLLPFPMRVRPSKTEGHFHLYVEQAMPWADAQALGRALVGIVDRKWLKTQTAQPGFIVRPAQEDAK